MRPRFFHRSVALAVGICACGDSGPRPADHRLDAAQDAPALPSGGAMGAGGATTSGGGSASTDAAVGTGGTVGGGGVAGSGGAGGTGPATGSGDGPGAGGSAPERDAGAGTDGGVAPTGKPRVLLMAPAAEQLWACDADGQSVADYRSALDFGPGYGRRTIWSGGRGIRWDAWPAPGGYPLNSTGGASRVLITADPSTGLVDARLDSQLKVLTSDGKVEASYPVPTSSSRVVLSPRGSYVYAASTNSTACQDCSAVVLERKNGTQVVSGIVTMSYPSTAAFSPDDVHFVYVPLHCEDVHIVNLSDGQTTAVPGAALGCPTLAQSYPSVAGFLTDGVVVSAKPTPSSAGNDVRLFFVDWRGKLTPLDTGGASSQGNDSLLAIHPEGRRALWTRRSGGTATTFEFDSSTLQSQPSAETYVECYGQATATRYELEASSVRACPCGSQSCTKIATLPTLEEPWTPVLVASPDRRFVVVRYDWYLDRMPQSEANALLYDARGALLLTLPNGVFSFDRTSAMAMDCYFVGSASQDCALINLATTGVTTLAGVNSYGFLDE